MDFLFGTDVARKAKQLSFGFEAAAFLKADTISYAAKAKDFNKYFRFVIRESVDAGGGA